MSPSTAPPKPGALCVFVTPQGPFDLDKFQQWGTRQSSDIPGLTQRTILTATDEPEDVKPYRYLAWYELDDISQIDEDTMKSVLESFPGTITSSDANLYEFISFDQRDNLGQRPPGTVVVWVGMTPHNNPTSAKAYHDFYVEEHLPILTTVPGWRCGIRYKYVTTFGEPKEYAAPFLTIHQYDEVNGLGGKEWKSSVTSARHAELQQHLARPPHRRVWKVESDAVSLAA
jgi:hypothetical protein